MLHNVQRPHFDCAIKWGAEHQIRIVRIEYNAWDGHWVGTEGLNETTRQWPYLNVIVNTASDYNFGCGRVDAAGDRHLVHVRVVSHHVPVEVVDKEIARRATVQVII